MRGVMTLLSIAAGLMLACLVVFPAEAAEAAARGFFVWATAVLPSLFPFMVCCQLLAASDALTRLGAPLDGLMRCLFRCPGEAAPLALLGFLSGSPGGAKLIAARRAEGALTRAQAERLACLTGTVSPVFLLGTLAGWTGIPRAGWLLLGAHWAGAVVVGMVFSRVIRERDFAIASQPSSQNTRRIPSLSEAISASAQAMLVVGGCIALGTVISAMAQRLFPFMPAGLSAGLHASLEMAGGAADITALRLPARTLLCALAAAPSLGGLSILAQNLAFLSGANVRAWPLLLARLLHAALSASIAWVFAPRLAPVAVIYAQTVSPAMYGAVLCVAPGALWLLSRLSRGSSIGVCRNRGWPG